MTQPPTAAPPRPTPAPPSPPSPSRRDGGSRHALLVGAGVFLSRVMGLVRERVFAHYLGNGDAAGAFSAAVRIPNFLQNLLGEGVLSSSFIPVYAKLLSEGEHDEADTVAGAVFGLLALVTGVLVGAGMLAAPWLVDAISPGFHGETRLLTVRLVRIVFPGTGTLVLSAWCLGVLNSHRKFFLSYAAPVLWNLAQIAVLIAFGRRLDEAGLTVYVAWAFVAGCVLQFGVQVPSVLTLLGRFKPVLSAAKEDVRVVVRNLGPTVVSRGVVNVSAYLDTVYASLIGAAAVSTLRYQQILYLLPVSLFGYAISAAELPAMSSAIGTVGEIAREVRGRLDAGLARLAFFVIPSTAAFLFFGDVVGAAIFETGRFGVRDSRYLWLVLAGSTVGLLAATMGRLYSSAFYALKDTRTPLWFAMVRVALTAGLAYWSATQMPRVLGVPREIGLVGITATTGLAAWLEFVLLRRALNGRIGKTGLPLKTFARLWAAAVAGGAAGLGVKALLVRWRGPMPGLAGAWGGGFAPFPRLYPPLAAVPILGVFGVIYLAIALGTTPGGPRAAVARLRRRLR